MIKQSEIKDIARQRNVPISTIERDYTQNWILLFLPKMAFKGGTCLHKVYFEEYRFSDDLDFTLLEKNKYFRVGGNNIKFYPASKDQIKHTVYR